MPPAPGWWWSVGRSLSATRTARYSGLIPIPHALVNPIVDAIISDDVDRFTELMASILRPPQLQNTDGDDMVLHTMRWKIAPGTDVGMALSGAGLLSEDDGWWRLVADTKNQPDSIVSTVQVEAETLTMTGEVNSDERAERLAAIIADALPEAALIDDYRRDIGDAADEHEPSDDGLPSFDDPEMFRVIEEMIIAREREWVDESIPALGGRTPRESVRDPLGARKCCSSSPRFQNHRRDRSVRCDPLAFEHCWTCAREPRRSRSPDLILNGRAVREKGLNGRVIRGTSTRRTAEGAPPQSAPIEAVDTAALETDRCGPGCRPSSGVGWRADPGFYVIDFDATLITAHSDKTGAAKTYKRGFGFHPLLAFVDGTGKRWPGSCGPATPDRTRQPIMSPCWVWR